MTENASPTVAQLLAQAAADAYRQARNNARLYATAVRAAETDPKKATAEAAAHDRTVRDGHKAKLLVEPVAKAVKPAEGAVQDPATMALMGAIDLVVDAASAATDALAWTDPRDRKADAAKADQAARIYELTASCLLAL